MGALRDYGITRLSFPELGDPEGREAVISQAVKDAAAEDYELYGEIGRPPDGRIIYLAREIVTFDLAALELSLAEGDEYTLKVLRELDASVPPPDGTCPRCGVSLRQWGRYCPGCAVEMGGDNERGEPQPAEAVKEALSEAGWGRYVILGSLRSAEGGGHVYFAQEAESRKLIAVRVLREFGLGPLNTSSGPGRLRIAVAAYEPPAVQEPPTAEAGWGVEPTRPLELGETLPDTDERHQQDGYDAEPEPWSADLTPIRRSSSLRLLAWAAAAVGIAALVFVVWQATVGLQRGADRMVEAASQTDLPPVSLSADDSRVAGADAEPAAEEMPAVPLPEETLLAYSVAVASVTTLNEAESMRERWSTTEHSLYVAPTIVRGRLYYRVLAGFLPEREGAEILMRQLVEEGVKVEGRSWDVRPAQLAFHLGTYSSAQQTDSARESLLAQNIPSYKVPAATPPGEQPAFHLYAGGYETADEARGLGEELERAGIETALVERMGFHEGASSDSLASAGSLIDENPSR